MISTKQFDRPSQAEAYSEFRPPPPPELVNVILNYLREKFPSPLGLAVDVGCGTGQSTLVLAPYFQSVIGCDVSKSQIREAMRNRKTKNVKYRVCKAECLPVKDHSVHLLTASTCFHWLDTQNFFREVKRVLAPGGVLAIYSSLVIYPVTGHADRDYELRSITNKFLYEDMKAYRSPVLQQAFEKHSNQEFPFDDVIRLENIDHTFMGSAAHVTGYIKSMSTFQNYRALRTLEADKRLHEYENRVMDILELNTSPEITPLTYKRNYFLILCR